MELNPQKRIARQVQRLGHAALRPRDNPQPLADLVHRLVVVAVHMEQRPIHLVQRGALQHPGGVDPVPVGARVEDLLLGGHVLNHGAPQHNIYHLHPPANA